MAICKKCGKKIRFIKIKGSRSLIVNSSSIYFVPDENGKVFVTTDGSMRAGRIATDGIRGFTLHEC